jgi:hypothetical protein
MICYRYLAVTGCTMSINPDTNPNGVLSAVVTQTHDNVSLIVSSCEFRLATSVFAYFWTRMREVRNTLKILVGKLEGRTPLGSFMYVFVDCVSRSRYA